MEYLLLEADDDGILEEMVNSHIQLGWEPQGGVAVTETALLARSDLSEPASLPGSAKAVRRYTQAMLLRTV